MTVTVKFVTPLLGCFMLNPLKILSFVALQMLLFSTPVQAAPQLPVINITVSDESTSEAGPDPSSFTITRSDNGALSDPVYVFVATTGEAGSWTSPDCTYEGMSRVNANVYRATIPPDQLSLTIFVTPNQDGIVEDDEELILTIQSNDGSYIVGPNDQAQVTILDDSPVVNLVVNDGNASEIGPDPGSFTITRSNNGIISQSLDVRVATTGEAGGWSSPDCSYAGMYRVNANVYRALIPPDQLSLTIVVTPNQDNYVEDEETVIFTLVDSEIFRDGETSTVSITVADYVGDVFKDSFEDP